MFVSNKRSTPDSLCRLVTEYADVHCLSSVCPLGRQSSNGYPQNLWTSDLCQNS